MQQPSLEYSFLVRHPVSLQQYKAPLAAMFRWCVGYVAFLLQDHSLLFIPVRTLNKQLVMTEIFTAEYCEVLAEKMRALRYQQPCILELFFDLLSAIEYFMQSGISCRDVSTFLLAAFVVNSLFWFWKQSLWSFFIMIVL